MRTIENIRARNIRIPAVRLASPYVDIARRTKGVGGWNRSHFCGRTTGGIGRWEEWLVWSKDAQAFTSSCAVRSTRTISMNCRETTMPWPTVFLNRPQMLMRNFVKHKRTTYFCIRIVGQVMSTNKAMAWYNALAHVLKYYDVSMYDVYNTYE